MATKKIKIRRISVKISHLSGQARHEGPEDRVTRFLVPILGPLKPVQTLPLEPKLDETSIRTFRQLLSDEKARILSVIKLKKPQSLYMLAKFLGRDFKAVSKDVKVLEKFGLIKLVPEHDKKTGKKRIKPILALDRLQVTFEI